MRTRSGDEAGLHGRAPQTIRPSGALARSGLAVLHLMCRSLSQASPPTPFECRDGNRDRLIGLLTERATKTLIYYLSETNQHLYYW